MAQTNAILPKARGMYAKRLSIEQYEELMRRRTVPEIAAILKKHPYFKESLSVLSSTEPHRTQLEELLNADIFKKYETLAKYDFSPESFIDYFIIECEVKAILQVLRLLSVGAQGNSFFLFSPFLEGKIHFDLFTLSQAKTFTDVLETVKRTPYYKVLYLYWLQDPFLKSYPDVETALIKYYYAQVFILAKKTLTVQEAKQVTALFGQVAENYNISLILRVKKYFSGVYTTEQIKAMLLPYHYHLPPAKLYAFLDQGTEEALLQMCQKVLKNNTFTQENIDDFEIISKRDFRTHARQVLHLTTSPSAAVAAFIFLTNIEKENVVNIIEGVRYGLPPEKIRALLQY